MTRLQRVLCAIAAVTCAIALLWWTAWAAHSLHGWAALPLGLTVGGLIYGVGSLLVLAAAGCFGEADQ